MITRIPGGCLRHTLRRSITASRHNNTKAGPSRPASRSHRPYRSDDYDLIPDVEDALNFGLSSGMKFDGRIRAGTSRDRTYDKATETIQPHLKYNQYAERWDVNDEDLDDAPVSWAPAPSEVSEEQARELVGKLGSGQGESATPNETTPTSGRRINLWPTTKSDAHGQSGQTTLYVNRGSLRYRSEYTKHLPAISITYHRLRDGCPCPKCIDPSTRQRTHTSPEAYHEIENSPFVQGDISEELIRKETVEGVEGLRVDWSKDHSAFYPLSRIHVLATGNDIAKKIEPIASRVFWDKDVLLARQDDLHLRYEELANPETRDGNLLKLLVQVQRFGVVVVKGVPTERTDNDDCTLREVMEWIGEIRNTFYGETWNVKNVANSKNVAYTNLNLGMHMDLL